LGVLLVRGTEWFRAAAFSEVEMTATAIAIPVEDEDAAHALKKQFNAPQ
jgi:hypothetical protein